MKAYHLREEDMTYNQHVLVTSTQWNIAHSDGAVLQVFPPVPSDCKNQFARSKSGIPCDLRSL